MASLAGLLVLLTLLLFAVESLVGLYVRSTVTAVAHDAARQVASDAGARSGDAEVAVVRADAALRTQLGTIGESTTTRWAVDDHEVVLAVSVPTPTFLPAPWRSAAGPPAVERTVRVRLESLR